MQSLVDAKKILETLIQFYTDQEGIDITYKIEEVRHEKKDERAAQN